MLDHTLKERLSGAENLDELDSVSGRADRNWLRGHLRCP